MHKWVFIFCCLWGLLSSKAMAGTYTLTDGTQITGEPLSYDEQGVRIKTGPDTFSPRISWNNFTQESLRQLRSEAKTPKEQAILDPLIEEMPKEAKSAEIVVKPITPPVRPSRQDGTLGFFALFSSPLGCIILLILYGAGLFAAYEVAVFRHQPPALVVGLAAVPFLGIASPIVFLCLPTRTVTYQAPRPAQAAGQETVSPLAPGASEGQASLGLAGGVATQTETVAVAETAPAAVVLPAPVIFRRGDYAFNRRFFETKLAGFFRLVPSEADKDFLIHIKSSRGDFVGKRISKVTPSELYLQIFSKEATADEMIPFLEVLEVQIRHKDLA